MSKKIRRGVFETNSSSTHAMAIQKYPNVLYPKFAGWTKEQLEQANKNVENDAWHLPYFNPEKFPKKVTFEEGEFGWEKSTIIPSHYNTKASYLYTAMAGVLSYDEFDDAIKRITKWLTDEGIKVTVQEYLKEEAYKGNYDCHDFIARPKCDGYGGYVDHVDETEHFVSYVIATKNHLFNYLFGDSTIKTGNDNDDCDLSFCPEDKQFIFKCTHDLFYKGN